MSAFLPSATAHSSVLLPRTPDHPTAPPPSTPPNRESAAQDATETTETAATAAAAPNAPLQEDIKQLVYLAQSESEALAAAFDGFYDEYKHSYTADALKSLLPDPVRKLFDSLILDESGNPVPHLPSKYDKPLAPRARKERDKAAVAWDINSRVLAYYFPGNYSYHFYVHLRTLANRQPHWPLARALLVKVHGKRVGGQYGKGVPRTSCWICSDIRLALDSLDAGKGLERQSIWKKKRKEAQRDADTPTQAKNKADARDPVDGAERDAPPTLNRRSTLPNDQHSHVELPHPTQDSPASAQEQEPPTVSRALEGAADEHAAREGGPGNGIHSMRTPPGPSPSIEEGRRYDPSLNLGGASGDDWGGDLGGDWNEDEEGDSTCHDCLIVDSGPQLDSSPRLGSPSPKPKSLKSSDLPRPSSRRHRRLALGPSGLDSSDLYDPAAVQMPGTSCSPSPPAGFESEKANPMATQLLPEQPAAPKAEAEIPAASVEGDEDTFAAGRPPKPDKILRGRPLSLDSSPNETGGPFKRQCTDARSDARPVAQSHASGMKTAAQTFPSGISADELAPGKWLSDNVVNLGLALLTACRPDKFTAIDSLALSEWEGAGVPDKSPRQRLVRALGGPLSTPSQVAILVPLYLAPARHWTLAVIHRSQQCVHFYDSMPSPDHTTEAKRLLNPFIRDNLGSAVDEREWPASLMSSPRQLNSSDCGIFVLAVAFHLITEQALPQHLDSSLWRRLFQLFLSPAASTPTPPTALEMDDHDRDLSNITVDLRDQPSPPPPLPTTEAGLAAVDPALLARSLSAYHAYASRTASVAATRLRQQSAQLSASAWGTRCVDLGFAALDSYAARLTTIQHDVEAYEDCLGRIRALPAKHEVVETLMAAELNAVLKRQADAGGGLSAQAILRLEDTRKRIALVREALAARLVRLEGSIERAGKALESFLNITT